jgi:hypothetical protein
MDPALVENPQSVLFKERAYELISFVMSRQFRIMGVALPNGDECNVFNGCSESLGENTRLVASESVSSIARRKQWQSIVVQSVGCVGEKGRSFFSRARAV